MTTTTITKKGQVTVPAPVRKALGIKPKDKIAFIEKGSDFVIKKALDFFSLRGSVKSKKTFDIKAMEKDAEKQAVRDYLKKK